MTCDVAISEPPIRKPTSAGSTKSPPPTAQVQIRLEHPELSSPSGDWPSSPCDCAQGLGALCALQKALFEHTCRMAWWLDQAVGAFTIGRIATTCLSPPSTSMLNDWQAYVVTRSDGIV